MKMCESTIGFRECTKCGLTKPLESFGKHAGGKFGRRSICRDCVSIHTRKYLQTERGKEVFRRSRDKFCRSEKGRAWRRAKAQRHRVQNPGKAKARSVVSQAIESGRLQRPNACEKCGAIGMVEAHHFLGYAEEHWLDVKWLCKSCHLREDGQISESHFSESI